MVEHVLVKAGYWLLSFGIFMDGVHFLTHAVSCMYSNIIRSLAPSFYKWSRRFSISNRFVSCAYLIGISLASPISYSLIYVSKRLLRWLENGRFSELQQKIKYVHSAVNQQRLNILTLLSVQEVL